MSISLDLLLVPWFHGDAISFAIVAVAVDVAVPVAVAVAVAVAGLHTSDEIQSNAL